MAAISITTDEINEIVNEVINENGGASFTDDEKKIIDKNLSKYPNLEKLIQLSAHRIRLYERYCPYRYVNSIKSNDIDKQCVRKIIRDTFCDYALGSFLLTEDNELVLHILRDIDSILTRNPILFQYNYGDNICRQLFDIYPEFLVYDKLKKLGYNPVHEPTIENTDSKPDFKIIDNENPIFIEIKTRHNSLCEELLYSDKPMPQFFDPTDDTQKTDDVLITAILNQISKFNNAQPNIPSIVVIYSIEPGVLENYLNILGEEFEERLYNRVNQENIASIFKFPKNLKMVVIFSVSVSHEISLRIYTKIGYSSNFCNLIVNEYKK